MLIPLTLTAAVSPFAVRIDFLTAWCALLAVSLTGAGQGPVRAAPVTTQWNVSLTADRYQPYLVFECALEMV